MARSLRGRLVLAAAISLALLGSATAGRSARRVRGARRGGGRPDSRRCGCGCGGGLPPPPPPPPPSSDCSACPVGQYLQTACTSTRNRVCASCSTRAGYCAAGHFLSGCRSSGAGRAGRGAVCNARRVRRDSTASTAAGSRQVSPSRGGSMRDARPLRVRLCAQPRVRADRCLTLDPSPWTPLPRF